MPNTVAFVLSGGGNFAALQVGALRALLERNITPHILVGTSAGAINAAYFAARPTSQGVDELAAVWREVTAADVYPGTHWHTLWRVLTRRESLYPSEPLHKFLAAHLPPDVGRFSDVHPKRLFISTAHLDSGDLHLYGLDRDESILEAVMGSTALPPFSPPWRGADGHWHVDGGAVCNLPLGVAVKQGATEIYALEITEAVAREERLRAQMRTMSEIGYSTVQTLLKYQLEADLAFVRAQRHVKLHRIVLRGPHGLSFRDFSRSVEMIEDGYQQTQAYLAALPQPDSLWQQWNARVKEWTAKLERAWKPKRYVSLSE